MSPSKSKAPSAEVETAEALDAVASDLQAEVDALRAENVVLKARLEALEPAPVAKVEYPKWLKVKATGEKLVVESEADRDAQAALRGELVAVDAPDDTQKT